MTYPERLFIDGRWCDAADPGRLAVVSPTSEDVIAEVQIGGPADVHRATKAASEAFRRGRWPELTADGRADLLDRFALALTSRTEALTTTIAEEAGIPISLAPIHVTRAIEFVSYYADLVRRTPMSQPRTATSAKVTVGQQPVGVVGAIGPWNIPLLGALSKIAPALAAGCTVVFKPSPETPLTALLMAEAAEHAELPPGVLNVVPATQAGSQALVADPLVAKVAFTGSTATGRAIALACAQQLKPYALELGGNAAAIVCDDIPVEVAGPGLVMTGLAVSNGEACVAQRRILVPRARRDEIVAAICAVASTLPIGDPKQPGTVLGPMITDGHRKRVLDHIADGQSQGAAVVHGGGSPLGLDRGYFVQPTVLVDVDNHMRIAREETFGPVVCVMTYDDINQAIAIANDTEYGLSASIWTADLSNADAIAPRLEAGSVYVNGSGDLDPNVPFGGVKQSGVGRELGPEGLSEFMHSQSIFRPAS